MRWTTFGFLIFVLQIKASQQNLLVLRGSEQRVPRTQTREWQTTSVPEEIKIMKSYLIITVTLVNGNFISKCNFIKGHLIPNVKKCPAWFISKSFFTLINRNSNWNHNLCHCSLRIILKIFMNICLTVSLRYRVPKTKLTKYPVVEFLLRPSTYMNIVGGTGGMPLEPISEKR